MAPKSNRKSASKWDQASERALLELWGEKMDELRGCRKNSHILLQMVTQLQALGFKYTLVELKTKMHNLSARYRKEKQNIGSTGGLPSEWDLFEDMQALLAPYRSYHSGGLPIDSIHNKECNKNMTPEEKWKINDQMSLLVPRKNHATSQCGSDSDCNNSNIETESEDDENVLEQNGQAGADVATDNSFVSVPGKSQYSKNSLHERQSTKKGKCSRRSVELDNNDDIDLFFLSMAKTIKKLPYREQVHLKKNISDLVFQAELKNMRSSNFLYNSQ